MTRLSRVRLLPVVALGMLALALSGMSGAMQPARPPAPWWADPAAIRRGARDFATGSCISCHTLAGVSSANAAANLTHEGRRRSPAWLLREIAHPTSQRPATPPGQARDLAAYLCSLH